MQAVVHFENRMIGPAGMYIEGVVPDLEIGNELVVRGGDVETSLVPAVAVTDESMVRRLTLNGDAATRVANLPFVALLAMLAEDARVKKNFRRPSSR